MAVTIDWVTGVITILKADTTLVDIGPPELRSYDTNLLRLALKALEDNEDGIHWPDTHTHAGETTVGAITYARSFNILAPYTVTFEAGSYGLDLLGPNNNIMDVLNYNSTQVRSNNSAGKTSNEVVADAWDAPRASHVTVGTFGEAVDAKITSRSSHDDPDPSGYLDVAITSRAADGAAMDLVADAVDTLSIDSTILARLLAATSVARADAREALGFVITVGAGSHTGTLCLASDQVSKALKGKPGLVLTGNNEGRAIRFTTDSDGSGSFGYTDWVGEGFATPLSQTDTIQA